MSRLKKVPTARLLVRRPRAGWRFVRGGPRGARHRARVSRRELVCGRPYDDLNHDAVMRIGGETPGRRAHFTLRFEDHVLARVAATSGRHLQPVTDSAAATEAQQFAQVALASPPGWRSRPSDSWPVVTRRYSVIRSLRASATIMVLRLPRPRSAVRLRYHLASGLSFWWVASAEVVEIRNLEGV